jgi:hypothetical protein
VRPYCGRLHVFAEGVPILNTLFVLRGKPQLSPLLFQIGNIHFEHFDLAKVHNAFSDEAAERQSRYKSLTAI